LSVMLKLIYTLGTGTRGIDNFLKIIKNFHIETVVDVRRFPTSKIEDFKKERLLLRCLKEGIEYIHLGDELGGYRKGGYEKWTKSDAFKSGIDKVAKIANNKIVCIICAETLPWKCHRRFIGKKLLTMGYRVIHIIDEKHTWVPKNESSKQMAFK